MKRFLSVLALCGLMCSFAWASPRQASVIPVRATHQRAQRHKAHKAGKHHTPKRHHRAV